MAADPFTTRLFISGVATRAELISFIHTLGTPEEQARLEQTLEDWTIANNHFKQIEAAELGHAETIDVRGIPEGCSEQIKKVEEGMLFKRTFSRLPYEIRMVEIDRLVACQRSLNLDYIEILERDMPKNPTLAQLIDICLSPSKETGRPLGQRLANNMHLYVSENPDFRFLGGFERPVIEEDIKASVTEIGFPLASIVLMFGLGTNTINILSVGQRHILNNGFHRVYALRGMGITHIPAVIQKVSRPYIELPEIVGDLPKHHLLIVPRPCLIKDFFNPKLVRKFNVKKLSNIVQIQWVDQKFSIPSTG